MGLMDRTYSWVGWGAEDGSASHLPYRIAPQVHGFTCACRSRKPLMRVFTYMNHITFVTDVLTMCDSNYTMRPVVGVCDCALPDA